MAPRMEESSVLYGEDRANTESDDTVKYCIRESPTRTDTTDFQRRQITHHDDVDDRDSDT